MIVLDAVCAQHRRLALQLVDLLDERGYLTGSLDDLAQQQLLSLEERLDALQTSLNSDNPP